MELIARLQNDIAPDVFTPRAVYDGRKNMFAPRALPLGPTGSREVRYATVTYSRSRFEPFAVPLPSRQREVQASQSPVDQGGRDQP